MKTAIFLVFFVAGSQGITEYHQNADEELNSISKSSLIFFPGCNFLNTDIKQSFKASRKDKTGLFFSPTDSTPGFCLDVTCGAGLYDFKFFRFDFGEKDTNLMILFERRSPPTHKIMINTKVFSIPTDSKLQKHAEEHAVFIEPITAKEVQDMRSEPRRVRFITTPALSLSWVEDIVKFALPVTSNRRRAEDVQDFLCAPIVMDPKVLTELSELQQKLMR